MGVCILDGRGTVTRLGEFRDTSVLTGQVVSLQDSLLGPEPPVFAFASRADELDLGVMVFVSHVSVLRVCEDPRFILTDCPY